MKNTYIALGSGLLLAAAIIMVVLGLHLWAAPTVGTPITSSPTIITTNTPTTVVITSLIVDPSLIPGSVNLVRLDGNGNLVGVVGTMHDDGHNGDAVGGDHVYSLQLTLNEPRQTAFEFEISAAFKGLLRRVVSLPLQFAAANPAGASLIDLTTPSSLIISATVGGQSASLDATGNIVTNVTLTIGEVLQGPAQTATLTLRIPGGILNGARSFPPGTPSLSSGETVVLVLAGPDAQGLYSLPELALDVYHIQTSTTSGQFAIVDQAYTNLDGTQAPNGDYSSFLQRSSAGQVPLSEFYSRLGVSP